ncbi:OadG family protein [Tepidibacter formicigenes]|jgi:Na+-transporting methylmalonyl-CoA/oxaloacetate decarboxylase gamma subunit|uniref:Oxaloacetate decarboxylase, gamma chain n=1 Tax=Tepidibacter formicigenes DSM 15518 TaxID=1123349 RepID=A0A1M6PNI4_9FIRM|nr:OadG family protein [Tepidibacter formicigenes]SHK09534.1 Oxaloacetate decarboxylase, gamma chain [Tepidibacter formicigenes DSM 15518]
MENITILESIKITFLSMSIVFISLLVISQILELFKVVFYKKDLQKQNSKDLEAAVTISKDNKYEEINKLDEEIDLVAALTAAVLASNNHNNSKIRIKSIKRVA